MKKRCDWCEDKPLYRQYHDEEWGVPLHDDQQLFEFLILEGMQAGLSWWCILQKRENFRKAFANFDPKKVARFSEKKLEKLLLDPGIIRNRLKVYGSVKNAKAFLKVQETHGSFDQFIWQFTDGQVIKNNWSTLKKVPAKTAQSDQMAKELKRLGFTFVGSTICYAFMQATGMVNDHLSSCYRYNEV